MLTFLYILSMGVLNALRGSGLLSSTKYAWVNIIFGRATFMLAMAVDTYFFTVKTDQPWWSLDLLFAAFWISFAPGWGKYMNAAFPNMRYMNETEDKPIDWLGHEWFGTPTTATQFATQCAVDMGLRGLLFVPIFVYLYFVNGHPLWTALGMLSMGSIYWARRVFPAAISIRIAEFATGCLLGGLIVG
jgi:hypothetical protein